METALSTDDATTPPRYHQGSSSESSTTLQSNDRSDPQSSLRATQRVRAVRLTTRIHPDIIIPYLYGEQRGRSINAIVNTTGCTIDYCALSPDELEQLPPSRGYVMNFLVSADSRETLEDATKQLRMLVERVQVHLQKKVRGKSGENARNEGKRTRDTRLDNAAAMKRGRGFNPNQRWTHNEVFQVDGSSWERPVCRERPRSMRHVEADKKKDGGRGRCVVGDKAAQAQALYLQQRNPSPKYFGTRRRVQRAPEQARWTPRYHLGHMRGKVGYTMPRVAAPHGENKEPLGIARNIRQPHYIYQGPPERFAPTEYSLYEYDEPRHENDVDFSAYDETADLTNENTGSNEAPEFRDQYQSVHRPHSRRNLKRPLSKMCSNGAPPPTIYRHQVPYIYDYTYADEDNDWMTEEEEVDVGYEYSPQLRPVEVPVVRQRRYFESTNAQQWSSPVGRGLQPVFKRRRVSREELSLNNEMTDDVMFATRNRDYVSPPRPNIPTVLVRQLDKGAGNAGVDPFPDYTGDFAEIHADGWSTPSSSTENAGLDSGHEDSVTNEVSSQHNIEVLVDSNANKDPESPARETLSEQQDLSANEEESDNAYADEHPIEHALQSEAVPLDMNVSVQETTVLMSPQRSVTSTSPPTRKTSESSVSSIDDNTLGSAANAMEMSAGKTENYRAVSDDAEIPLEAELPVQVSVFSKSSTQHDCGLHDEKLSEPIVGSIVTDTIRINNHAIASLERLNKVEADFMSAKTSLLAQEDKLRQVESSTNSCRRLGILCGIVYELQCHVGSHSCSLNACHKQDILGKLDDYLETISIQNEQTLQEKADALQAGVEHVLAVERSFVDDRAVESKTKAVKPTGVPNSNTMSPIDTEVHYDRHNDANDTVWEDDDWFEEGAFGDPASESDDQENVAVQIFSTKSNLKLKDDFLAVKIKEGVSPRCPRELPQFVWSLIARVTSSDPQSHIMRVTLKRLMDEIANGDPYYYLHPTNGFKDADVSSPLHSSPSPGCEFGCRGASALKWERKLVSQISSRMKSFDNVAYSLARSSVGKEVLNRKKMNSIIRKLHLVAVQLHSLVSHLYCVKDHATCKEVDSLPIALNNSHFERKMGVYKSRLKLLVPHKYQLQIQQEQHGSNEPVEELVRDTYEFFPELLLCIDIWGYNYRESLVKRYNDKSMIAGPGAILGVAPFPIRYFRAVEKLAFDFENDSNYLLHCICDELLNIVCLWNDFKWTDNLETVALDRVISFESAVTASILKILELYAHHLQALWSAHLLDEPDQLRSIQFTEFNAYYSDRSQGSLNTAAYSQSRAPGVSEMNGDDLPCDSRTVAQELGTEILEQRLAEEYWNRKVTALSILNPGDDTIEGDTDSKSQLLSVETICSWDHHTLVSYFLRWSDVYAIRTEVNALSSVTNHMMKHEVQKFRFVGRDDTSVTSGSYVNKTMVDSSTRQLLAAVSRAQMLIRDALIGSEKLALHSASNQLPNEKKYSKPAELEVDKTSKRGNGASLSSMEAASSCQTLARTNGADARSDEAASENVRHVEAIALENADSFDATEDVDIDTGMTAEQPELKDLIQLLAVTKQDMQELCGRRPRSARMREKVQMQSLQLARQTVEIFRNIKNMYASQRR